MRIDEAQVEQSILTALKSADGGLETIELVKGVGAPDVEVREALARLKVDGQVDSRMVGKSEYWYALMWTQPKNILVVEDDKDIAKLIRLSVGKEYVVKEVYTGESAIGALTEFKPDLIVLDLMLPGMDGLEVCRRVKSDPLTKNIPVVIVSAADAAINRFWGIQKGADYYIRKPFDPSELRALTNIFLKKHGSPFDPLVDLPDIQRLIKEIKECLDEKGTEFVKVDIQGLSDYENAVSKKEAKKIVRLVSQMLQDKVKDTEGFAMLAYLGENAFVLAAKEGMLEVPLQEVEADFRRVATFVKQNNKLVGDLYEKLERGKTGGQFFALTLTHYAINMDVFRRKFEEGNIVLPKEEADKALAANIDAIRKYTLDQVRSAFEKSKADVQIEEKGGNIRITAGRNGKK